MSPTEYDADIFFGKKFIFFWRDAFQHQNSQFWNTTVASLAGKNARFASQVRNAQRGNLRLDYWKT